MVGDRCCSSPYLVSYRAAHPNCLIMGWNTLFIRLGHDVELGGRGRFTDFPQFDLPSEEVVFRLCARTNPADHLHFVDRRYRALGDLEQAVNVVGCNRSVAGLTFFVQLGDQRVPVLVT